MRSTEERNRLAAENVALGKWVAARYASLARDEDGVFSASLVGLLQAAEFHDPGKGAFSSFAVLTCRHAIFAELKRQRRHRRESPLFVIAESGDEVERKDLPPVPPPDVEPPLLLALMRAGLSRLPPLEKTVLELRWGLTGEEHTFPEVGEALGMPASRARRLEARAMAALRKEMRIRRTFRDRPAWGGWKP